MAVYGVIWKKRQVFFEGSLGLKPIRYKDIQFIRKWRNEQVDVLRQKEKIGHKQQIRYYKEYIKPSFLASQPVMILFSFFKKGSSKLLGYGGFVHIDWKAKTAEVSFLCDTRITKNKRLYKDVFRSFILAMTRIGSAELGFTCLYSETYSFRKFHLKILESCQYKQYGIKKNAVYAQGKQYDSFFHQNILQ